MNEWAGFLPLLLGAAGTTLWISWLALVVGAVGGFAIALLRMAPYRILRAFAITYIELLRSIPILVVIFFSYFGLPLVASLHISPFTAITIALSLHASAMMSEVIRAGIESVHKGQWEAARASGMTTAQAYRTVIGPQALRVIIPPTVGIYIITIKESSLASIIGYVELTRTGLLLREQMYGSVMPIVSLALIYFAMNFAISICGDALERRLSARTALRSAS